MRRILALLAALAIIASACAESAVTAAEATAPDDTAPPAISEVEEPAADAAGSAVVEAEPVEAVLPTGREAIAAAEDAGRPYILWFWGAH